MMSASIALFFFSLRQSVRDLKFWLVVAAVEVAWIFKVQAHGEGTLLDAAQVGPIPGAIVLALAALLPLVLLALAWSASEDLVD